MTERPIPLKGEMARAILDGRKTQTRRKVKLTADGHVQAPSKHLRWYPTDTGAIQACRYGQAGDLLWVRETWAKGETAGVARYRATDPQCDDTTSGLRWRPSIHMPRWASRITLRITDIRVERLQDISEDDARAEGVFELSEPVETYGPRAGRVAFKMLWNTINGPGAWEANPWVWVVAFERVKP